MNGLGGGLFKQLFQLSKNDRSFKGVRFASAVSGVKQMKEIPGPLNIPILGSLWQFMPIIGSYDMMHLDICAEDYYKKYGSIVKENFGSLSVVHFFEPADFEVVAKATLNKPLRLGFLAIGEYRDSHPEKYNSPGLLPVNDDRWWKLRQAFQKPVSPIKEARDFLGPTDDITKEFVDKLQSGAIIEDFMLLANRLNMELVCKLLFDERVHSFDDAAMAPDSYLTRLITEAVELAEGIGDQDRKVIMWRYFKNKEYKKMENTLHLMEEFVMKMMDKVKSKGDLSKDKSIAAQFMNDPKIHEKELLAIMIDLLLGGIHTTAITSCFLLYYASQSDRVLAKLKEEARRLIPPGAAITNSVLNEAVYTRAVLKETFRMSPIATAQGRVLPEDLTISGYKIPKGVMVILQNVVACRQERHFKKAKEFMPERWIKGSPEYQQVHPYLVLPFGLGLRSCIARRRAEQNLLVLTLRMFSQGEVKWLRGDELGFITPFMITPDGPVKIKFTRDI